VGAGGYVDKASISPFPKLAWETGKAQVIARRAIVHISTGRCLQLPEKLKELTIGIMTVSDRDYSRIGDGK
jgi:hypothetical protein